VTPVFVIQFVAQGVSFYGCTDHRSYNGMSQRVLDSFAQAAVLGAAMKESPTSHRRVWKWR